MKRFLAACVLGVLCAASGWAASLEEDVQRYVALFKGDPFRHQDASESLAWMGLSDPRLFDVIEQRLLTDYATARSERSENKRTALYVRALGFSGNPKYVPTINRMLGEASYQRVARTALEDLPDYQKWNPIISNRASFDPKYSDDVNRVLNMLRSDDILLKRLGAKRVYFENHDEVLLETLAQQLKALYPTVDGDSVDALSWMVKALARSSGLKYRALFEEVEANARSRKLRDYAKRAAAGRI